MPPGVETASQRNLKRRRLMKVEDTIKKRNEKTGDIEENKIAIFYNLFVKKEEDIPRVRALVDEQMSYVHQASAFQADVYVNSIGVPMPIPNTTLISHHDHGDENIALHSLWEYCIANPQEKVAYLHSKGSYHSTSENEKLRKMLTKATLSDECANLPSTCNICSLRFSPQPHPHTSGNMWLARCSYIEKLLDPTTFREKMDEVNWSEFDINGRNRTHWFDEKQKLVGRGRYADEHWAHSHPAAKPCDVYTDPKFSSGYANLPSEKEIDNLEWDLQPGPRFDRKTMQGNLPLDFGSRLDDRLTEYEQLYNETPSAGWWGWNFLVEPIVNDPTLAE